MNYKITNFTVSQLVGRVSDDKLSLRPSYQRNEVWTPADQRELISTILKGWPMPNLFILRKYSGRDEMVDGKQRTLAIYNYINDRYYGPDKKYFSELDKDKQSFFLNYEIPVVLIEPLTDGTRIEAFYALVNKSGLNLNRPEITKAEHAEKPFFKLVDRLTRDSRLLALDIFTERNKVRLNDFELISEVLATFAFGLFDKKTKIEDLYEIEDPKNEIWSKIENDFETLLGILSCLNDSIPLSKTRFKKRADFLSLCYFYYIHSNLQVSDLVKTHQVFYSVSPGIAPSNQLCDPLRAYAHNCVSQSNSKTARDARNMILIDLLANRTDKPSKSQTFVIEYFGISDEPKALVRGTEIYHLNYELLNSNRPDDHLFGEPESIEFKL